VILFRELVGAMRFARLASNEKAQSMYTNATMNGPLPEFIVKLMKTLQVFSGPYKLKENQVILPSTFFMLFPILSYVCCDYPEETVSSAFSILNRYINTLLTIIFHLFLYIVYGPKCASGNSLC